MSVVRRGSAAQSQGEGKITADLEGALAAIESDDGCAATDDQVRVIGRGDM